MFMLKLNLNVHVEDEVEAEAEVGVEIVVCAWGLSHRSTAVAGSRTNNTAESGGG